MGKFNLIQRGSFRKDPHSKTSFLSGREEALIDPDYMGSAEFEWGAIPKAYRRIFANFHDYELFVNTIKPVNGSAPFNVFCKKEFAKDIITEISNYIAKPYHTKEYTNLEYHFKDPACSNEHNIEDFKFRRETDFWWCIDNTNYGDWIAFIGAEDRRNSFIKIMNNDYHKLWESISEEEQKNILSQIY